MMLSCGTERVWAPCARARVGDAAGGRTRRPAACAHVQANLTARDRLRAARVDPERCASASATSASDGLHALVARDYVAASVAIADAMRVHELTGVGEALTTEGETGHACFVVLKGELDVSVAGWGHTATALAGAVIERSTSREHGAPVATLRVGPGACLGARTMVLGTPRDFSARAAAPAPLAPGDDVDRRARWCC